MVTRGLGRGALDARVEPKHDIWNTSSANLRSALLECCAAGELLHCILTVL
jgi:hypothetical protein